MLEWVNHRDTTDAFDCDTGRLVGRVERIELFGHTTHYDASDARMKPFVHLGSFRRESHAQAAIREMVGAEQEGDRE